MQFRIFTISAVGATESAIEELNQFLRSHQVVNVERQLIQDGQNSIWTFCVSWMQSTATDTSSNRSAKKRIDYREVLNEQDFAVFARLRTLRKELADAENVPAYALSTNEHLAEMVRRKVASKSALSEIRGVGEARVEKYGDAFLAALNETTSNRESTGHAEA